MRVEDLILVSVDDHVVEPADVFERHLPARYRGDDAFPHVVRNEAGDDVWIYDNRSFPNIGLNAVAGRPRDEFGVDPTSFDEMRRGCWDVADRVGDMNANGVLGSLCFPSFPRLCGQVFAEADDKDTALIALEGLQRLARRGVVRLAPWPVHPARHPADLGHRPDGAGTDPQRRARRQGGVVLGEPGQAGLPEPALQPLGPVLGSLPGHGHRPLPAHRLVVAAHDHRAGRRRSTWSRPSSR